MFAGCEIFALILLFGTALLVPAFLIMGWIFIFIVWIVSMIDAVSVAQKINKGE